VEDDCEQMEAAHSNEDKPTLMMDRG